MKLSLDRVLSRFANLREMDKLLVLETFYADVQWKGQDIPVLLSQLVGAPLTPAQQHADEMLDALKTAVGIYPPRPKGYFERLIEKIEPPKPVTLSDAIATLSCLVHDTPHAGPGAMQQAKNLLDRYAKEVRVS